MDNKQQHVQTAPSSKETEQFISFLSNDDIYEFITKEEVEDIERAYEAQVQQCIDYHNG